MNSGRMPSLRDMTHMYVGAAVGTLVGGVVSVRRGEKSVAQATGTGIVSFILVSLFLTFLVRATCRIVFKVAASKEAKE